MTPKEYLRQLQKLWSANDVALLSAAFMGAVVDDNSNACVTELERSLLESRRHHDAAVEARHARILGWLTSKEREPLAADVCAAGGLECADIHAAAIAVPGGDGIVLIFPTALNALLVQFTIHLLVMDSNSRAGGDSKLVLRCRFADLLRDFLQLGVVSATLGRSPKDISDVANQLASVSMDFVHAHELAHVVLGHVEQADVQSSRDVSFRREQEIEADQFALHLLLRGEWGRFTTRERVQVIWGGVWVLMQCLMILEKTGAVRSWKHPDTHMRARELQRQMQAYCHKVGVSERAIFRFSGPLSQAIASTIPASDFDRIRFARSAIVEMVQKSVNHPQGLMKSRSQLTLWLSHAGVPTRLLRALGGLRAQCIRSFESMGIDPRAMSLEERLAVADSQDHPGRRQMHVWMHLDPFQMDLQSPAGGSLIEEAYWGNIAPRAEQYTTLWLDTLKEADMLISARRLKQACDRNEVSISDEDSQKLASIVVSACQPPSQMELIVLSTGESSRAVHIDLMKALRGAAAVLGAALGVVTNHNLTAFLAVIVAIGDLQGVKSRISMSAAATLHQLTLPDSHSRDRLKATLADRYSPEDVDRAIDRLVDIGCIDDDGDELRIREVVIIRP